MFAVLMATTLITSAPIAWNDAESAQTIAVEIELSATSLTARNHSDAPHVLVLRNQGQSLSVTRTLRVGDELSFSFPRHAMQGVELEILSSENGLILPSGAVSLDELVGSGTETLWLQQPGPSDPVLWLEASGLINKYTPETTFAPAAVWSSSSSLTRRPAPRKVSGPHVPVVTPSDRPDDYGPPDLEDKPLPPV